MIEALSIRLSTNHLENAILMMRTLSQIAGAMGLQETQEKLTIQRMKAEELLDELKEGVADAQTRK